MSQKRCPACIPRATAFSILSALITATLKDEEPAKAKEPAQVVDPTNATYDPYDGELFKAAQRRFWSDVKKAGLSRKVCERTLEEQGCLQPAGAALTRLAQSSGSSFAGGRSDPED